MICAPPYLLLFVFGVFRGLFHEIFVFHNAESNQSYFKTSKKLCDKELFRREEKRNKNKVNFMLHVVTRENIQVFLSKF